MTKTKAQDIYKHHANCCICGVEITPENKAAWSDRHKTLAFDTNCSLKQLDEQAAICRLCYAGIQKDHSWLGNTLKKEEILRLKKLIGSTFKNARSITQYPFKIFYQETALPTHYPVQALFTVPKRNFKRAVKRNLLRRRIKEAYRQHKHELYNILQQEHKQLAVIIIYINHKEMTYNEIEEKLMLSLQKLIKTIQ